MRKTLKVFLIACGVIVIAYGIYFAIGRPAVPLPSFHYTVSQGNPIYDIVKGTESGKVTVTWATDGEIEPSADGVSLGKMLYNMETLGNSADLATAYMLPESNQTTPAKIVRFLQLPRAIPKIVGGFFYYVIRVKLTLNIYAK